MSNKLPEITIYLDSNQSFRVFEREKDTLLPRFLNAIREQRWKLVFSDAHIVEILNGLDSGANASVVRQGLVEMDSLAPHWVCLSKLPKEEIISAFTQYQSGAPFQPLNPLLNWPQFFKATIQGSEVKDADQLARLSMPDAILAQYSPGCLQPGNKQWSKELQSASDEYRDLMKNYKSKEDARRKTFIDMVIQECKGFATESDDLSGFAEELINNPNVCPAFRLSFELSVFLLEDERSKWTFGRFFDHGHALALPYVDVFVTDDGGLRQAVSVYDNRVLGKAGIQPYSSRLYPRLEDLPGLLRVDRSLVEEGIGERWLETISLTARQTTTRFLIYILLIVAGLAIFNAIPAPLPYADWIGQVTFYIAYFSIPLIFWSLVFELIYRVLRRFSKKGGAK